MSGITIYEFDALVLPFCLRERTLAIPQDAPFAANFNRTTTVAALGRAFESPKLPESALT